MGLKKQFLEILVVLKGLFEGPKEALFGNINILVQFVKEKIDWVKVFTDKYCGGSVDEYDSVMSRFARVNSKSSKQEANAIIGVYIEHGAKEAMLREVFGIGYTRYEKRCSF